MICYQDKDMQLDAMLDAFENLLPLCWFLSYWFDWLVSAISAIQQLRWGSIGGYVSHVGPPLSLANLRDQPSGPRAFLRLPCLRASPRSWGLSWSCLSSARKAGLSPLFSSSVVLLYSHLLILSSVLLHSPVVLLLCSYHRSPCSTVGMAQISRKYAARSAKVWAKSTPMQRPSPL